MTQQGGSSYLLCYHAQCKSDDRDRVPSFPSALPFLFHPLLWQKHTFSLPPWSAMFPCENKAYVEGGSTSDGGSLWPYWPDQQGTGWQVLQSLFSPQTLLLSGVSLHKGGEHRAIFKRGFSLSIVTRLWKRCHFPWQSASAVLLEGTDQMTQRSDPFFLYLSKGLIPCLRRAFFLLAEQGLFLCGTGNFLVPVDHGKQEEWSWSFLVQDSQDFKPIFSIICSYTVHAIAAIRVRLRARGTPPRKKPTNPKSCNRR